MIIAITVDGRRWEIKPPKQFFWATSDVVMARTVGSKGPYIWKVSLRHVVATREDDDE